MRFRPIIYLFILTGSLLISCKKEEVVPVGTDKDFRIAFGLEGVGVSKAVHETTVSEIAANGFNVAGVMSEGMVFFNEKAIKDEDGIYRTSTDYYYPMEDAISFFAVYPLERQVVFINGSPCVQYDSPLGFDEDLVLASRKNVTMNPSVVGLTFRHVLSQLKFTFIGSDTNADYILKSLTVLCRKKGTCDFDGVWTPDAETAELSFISSEIAVPTNMKLSLEESKSCIPTVIQVCCEWETYQNGVKTATYSRSTPDLDSADAIVMEQGKRNTINLVLPNEQAKEIVFTVTVNPWDEDAKDIIMEE